MRGFRVRLCWVSGCLIGVFLASTAGGAELVSINSAGTDSGNGSSTIRAISADSRLVAFRSTANDLGAMDTNGVDDIYVRDHQTGTTTLVSINHAGTGSSNSNISVRPAISPDGRFVVFESEASDFVASDTNGLTDIFLRDLQAETTTLISINHAGTDSGNGFSDNPRISANGRYIAFDSGANDLETTDTDNNVDVYVRNLQTGTTALVSINSAGSHSGNGASFDPAITADGRFVAFVSMASNLVETDSNGLPDVFVRDLQASNIIVASINNAGTDSGNSASQSAVISDNGRALAFSSQASNLVTNDSNAAFDVFVIQLPSEVPAACDCDAPEAIKGGPGADTLAGTAGPDIICGLGGNDRLIGRGGNDCIDAGPGHDNVSGGAGNDTINGGEGADLLRGSYGMDTITGGDGADLIMGGYGNDTIDGGNGADVIKGESGNDTIDGADGADLINGGWGTDRCINGELMRSCENP